MSDAKTSKRRHKSRNTRQTRPRGKSSKPEMTFKRVFDCASQGVYAYAGDKGKFKACFATDNIDNTQNICKTLFTMSKDKVSKCNIRKHQITYECNGKMVLDERNTVIGSGGSGLIVRTTDDEVIKMLRSVSTSQQIKMSKEFDLQLKCYTALFNLKHNFAAIMEKGNYEKKESELYQRFLYRIEIPQPLKWINCPLTFDKQTYGSGIIMAYVKGMPSHDFNWQDTSNSALFPNVHILPVHTEGDSKIFLVNDDEPASVSNPPRYYMLNMAEANSVRFLTKMDSFISRHYYALMGCICALTTFLFRIDTNDLEILLGQGRGTKALKLRLLDYGAVGDIDDQVRLFISTQRADVSDTAKDKACVELAKVVCDLTSAFMTKSSFPMPDNHDKWELFSSSFMFWSKLILAQTFDLPDLDLGRLVQKMAEELA